MSNELLIEDIQPGDGKEVVKGALITTQYRGTLEDGTVFDSSYERGKPFQCVIGTGRVIKGWDRGSVPVSFAAAPEPVFFARQGMRREIWPLQMNDE